MSAHTKMVSPDNSKSHAGSTTIKNERASLSSRMSAIPLTGQAAPAHAVDVSNSFLTRPTLHEPSSNMISQYQGYHQRAITVGIEYQLKKSKHKSMDLDEDHSPLNSSKAMATAYEAPKKIMPYAAMNSRAQMASQNVSSRRQQSFVTLVRGLAAHSDNKKPQKVE